MFGAPITFNPTLVVPIWIVGLLAPALTWLALYFDILPKIMTLFSFWCLSGSIRFYAVGGMIGLSFTFFILILSQIIYYLSFKVYDRQCMQKEEEDEEKRDQLVKRKTMREHTEETWKGGML